MLDKLLSLVAEVSAEAAAASAASGKVDGLGPSFLSPFSFFNSSNSASGFLEAEEASAFGLSTDSRTSRQFAHAARVAAARWASACSSELGSAGSTFAASSRAELGAALLRSS